MKKRLSILLEWIRPVGIAGAYFLSEFYGSDAISKFHLLGPVVVLIMSGSVTFESLVLGAVASDKIGYPPNRAYQIQSGLNHLSTALAALLVLLLPWGRYADATLVIVMLLFFSLSSVNHLLTAVRDHNLKPVNWMRPIMTLLLLGILLPAMIQALRQ